MKSTLSIDRHRVLYHTIFWILFFLSSMYRFENNFDMFRDRIFILAGHKLIFTVAFFYLYDLRLTASAEKNFLILFVIFALLILLYIYTNFQVYGWIVNHFELPDYLKVVYQANWDRMSTEGPWTMLKNPVFLFVKALAILFFPLILKITKRSYFASLSNVRMEQEKLQLEIDFFKSRVNPVFLLNTLRSIRKFSEKEDERAPEMILKLSHLMRYSLYESHSDKIELQKEIDFLEEYVTLQESRLKDQVNISFFLTAKNISRVIISPMLLFPFFEKAFQGASSVVEAELNAEGRQLTLKLKADKKPLEDAGREGILNARLRIFREYENRHTIRLIESDTHFELELSLELSNHNPS